MNRVRMRIPARRSAIWWYRLKFFVRGLLYGPPPIMNFEDWLDGDKRAVNARYPWLAEEWRAVALSYARAFTEEL